MHRFSFRKFVVNKRGLYFSVSFFFLRCLHEFSNLFYSRKVAKMLIKSTMSPESFWKAATILINKFNVINKRLWGCKTLFSGYYKPEHTAWDHPEGCTKLEHEDDLQSYIKTLLAELQVECCSGPKSGDVCIEVLIIELLPKLYSQKKAYQLVFMEIERDFITFYDITPDDYNQNLCPKFRYSLALENGTISLKTSLERVTDSKSYQWLADQVLPQFVKWGEEETNRNPICTESLSLISTDKYYKKYNELKLKYGKEMVKVWPEGTDPSKYVYEDVAIATYLLLLWEHGNEGCFQKKSFVDLGCGNGLLVYILTKEGHTGVGIDVRKRQIWDMYPDDVKLEVKTIIPSDGNLFPEADWLIGNHSDELTPWIPVIAARSSFKCNFFLLPCCAFNFDGTKYQRKDSSKSQYTEYLQYVKHICESCGFVACVDRLKIPSTKRICLVGQRRLHTEEEYQQYCNDIKNLIDNTECGKNKSCDSASWVTDFKPRESVERVRNCTKIDKSIIESIVNSITKHLLEGCNLEGEWSCGKLVNLCELISLLTEDELTAMKAECGGLQTLLRNNHHIFKVQSGKVQLRYPKTIEEVHNNIKKQDKNIKVKQKPCWFYTHHPQGCPLINSKCSYLHETF